MLLGGWERKEAEPWNRMTKAATGSFPSSQPTCLIMSLSWKIPFFSGHLMFTQQEKQMHHHQHRNFSELDGKQKSKGSQEMVLDPMLSNVLSGHCAGGTGGTHVLIPMKNTSRNTKKSYWERMINVHKFYLIWSGVGSSPWKCKCFSFSHYFIKNVTLRVGRESKSECLTSGETHRKFHLQSELRSGI